MNNTELFTQFEVSKILVLRFNGESLQSVADQFKTSREVIRSIESQYIRHLEGENK